jgi:prepilin-type N-terminal cleavage/methylation domain-containing protein
MNNQKGFTLIELLIVIAIIAILAVAAAPRFMDMMAQSAQSSCFGNQAAIDTAVEVWKFNNPVAAEAGTKPTNDTTAGTTLVGPGMLKAPVVCPRAGTYAIDLNVKTTCSYVTSANYPHNTRK